MYGKGNDVRTDVSGAVIVVEEDESKEDEEDDDEEGDDEEDDEEEVGVDDAHKDKAVEEEAGCSESYGRGVDVILRGSLWGHSGSSECLRVVREGAETVTDVAGETVEQKEDVVADAGGGIGLPYKPTRFVTGAGAGAGAGAGV